MTFPATFLHLCGSLSQRRQFSLIESQQQSHPIIVISLAEKSIALVPVFVCAHVRTLDVSMVRDAV